MRILVDECAPRALKQAFAAHGYECFTVQEAGWSGKANGELLRLADDGFDVFVTLDTNLVYQQNLTARKIGIVILRARSNRLGHIGPHFPACVEAVRAIKPGEIIFVDTTL
jgi:predicted nuclease of predicted toxin-antitoxin system